MVELLQSGFDVAWHGYMHLVILVVPIYGDADIKCSFPVVCYFLIFFEGRNQVLCILFYSVFYPKIVDDKGKLDGFPFVCPKSWYYLSLGLFVF